MVDGGFSTPDLNFGQALERLKAGARLARRGWNGADQWLHMQNPDEHSKMKRRYIYIKPVDGLLVPWVASQTDLLAEDWYVVI